jgi:hypothetical protein
VVVVVVGVVVVVVVGVVVVVVVGVVVVVVVVVVAGVAELALCDPLVLTLPLTPVAEGVDGGANEALGLGPEAPATFWALTTTVYDWPPVRLASLACTGPVPVVASTIQWTPPSSEYSYPRTGAPPSWAGAVNVSVAPALVASTDSARGALGAPMLLVTSTMTLRLAARPTCEPPTTTGREPP